MCFLTPQTGRGVLDEKTAKVEDVRGRCLGTEAQGCQMVYFQSKNPNLGKFWRA
jgi:hypothetical protein